MITPRAIINGLARFFRPRSLAQSAPSLVALEEAAAEDPSGFSAIRLISLFIDGSLSLKAVDKPGGPFEKIALQSPSGRLRVSLFFANNRPIRLLAAIDGQSIALSPARQRQADLAAEGLAFNMGLASMSPALRVFLDQRKALVFAPKRLCQVQPLTPQRIG